MQYFSSEMPWHIQSLIFKFLKSLYSNTNTTSNTSSLLGTEEKKNFEFFFARNIIESDSFYFVMMQYLNPNSYSIKELFAGYGATPLVLGRKKSTYACKAKYVTCLESANI